MIINYPTGFYRTILPQTPSDSTSVTFTISNNVPPRTELIFPKLSRGIESRQRSPNLGFDRGSVGDLVFSVSSADRSQINNNARLLEIGQILNFTDGVPITTDPMLVAQLTEIRHDTSKCDYALLGLNANDIVMLETATAQKLADLQDELNALKRQRIDAEQTVAVQQKLVNDFDRNIRALEVILGDMPDDDLQQVYNKLLIQRQVAITTRNAARELANQSAAQATSVADELRTMSTVVK